MKKNVWIAVFVLLGLGLLAACAQPTPQVVEKPITVVVEKEVPVEKQVIATVIVEKEKVVKETVVVHKEKVVKETVVVEKVVQEPVHLVFWHTQEPEAFRGKLLNGMIEDFQKEYPWITIESVYQGSYSDLYKKIMAAIAAGETPDLSVSYPSMIAGGHLPWLSGGVHLPTVWRPVPCLAIHKELCGAVVQPFPAEGSRLRWSPQDLGRVRGDV